jgi:hypothetical protein
MGGKPKLTAQLHSPMEKLSILVEDHNNVSKMTA